MSASPLRRTLLATCLLLVAALVGATPVLSQNTTAKSEVVRIRIDDPSAQVYQVFLDRKPVTLLYRKGTEVGFEITAGEDGIACRHDVAVVTTDGRLADLKDVDLCSVNWVLAIDTSRLSGGTPASTPPEPSDEETDEATTARRDAASECGWLAIMACAGDRESAESESRRIMGGVSVIATDDWSGFDPGQFCAAQGPYATESEAQQNATFFKGKGAPDAYAQQACEAGDGAREAALEAGEADPGESQQTATVSPGWEFTPPRGSDDRAAILSFADPASGKVEIVGACTPGGGAVALTFYRAPPDGSAGTGVDALLSTEAYRGQFSGTIGELDPGAGSPTVTITLDADDRLWDALARHRGLYVQMGTSPGYQISLRGSAGPVRQFAGSCADRSSRVAEEPRVEPEDERRDPDRGEDRPDDATEAEPGPPPAGRAPPAVRYVCQRGPVLQVYFPGRGARAVVSVDGDEPIVLRRIARATWRSGRFALRAGARRAFWDDGEGDPFSCRRR